MKNILIIAFHFPPIVTTGTFRTMAWVKHLIYSGWNVSVITTSRFTDNIEKNYEAQLLEKIKIYRVDSPDLIFEIKNKMGKNKLKKNEKKNSPTMDLDVSKNCLRIGIKDYLTYFLKMPDKYIGWFFSSLPLILKDFRKKEYDVIYSTSPFATAHLIAFVLKKRLKSRWIADFRDPWIDNPFREFPGRVLNKIDAFLERTVLRTADQIVCVTPNMTNKMRERYPILSHRIHTITNGYDLQAFVNEKEKRNYPPENFVIVHPGVFYGPRSPIPLFETLKLIAKEHEECYRKIRLLLIGGSDYQGRKMEQICCEYGISDHVDIIPYIPKKEVIGYLKGADCLLLVGFYGKHQDLQLPGKIFDYIAVGKPIFAIAPKETQIGLMLNNLSLSSEIADPRDIEEIKRKLLCLMARKCEFSEPDPKFEWGHLFSKLEQIFAIDQPL